MPSKRQPSKQRRAAQNRAQREALAARREHASQSASTAAGASSTSSSSSSSSSSGSGAKPRGRSGLLSGLLGGGTSASSRSSASASAAAAARPIRPLGGLGGRIMGDTAGEPGARGVLFSVPLGIAAAVWLLGFAKLDVDDRGEPLPISGRDGFRGLYLAAREALTGQEVTPQKELGVSAIGPFWLLMAVVPLLVVLGVFVIFRYRRAQSMYWTVTIGMLLIAATVLLLGRIEYIGSMAALTWASFQIRRSELPGKMAEREAARAARAEAAATAAEEADEEEYDEDEYDEDAEYEEEAYYEEDEDADAESGEGDETEYDEDEYEEGDEYVEEADVEYEDDIDATEGAEASDAEADEADDAGEKDYDESILEELEAEIDEDERRGGSGSTKPGSR